MLAAAVGLAAGGPGAAEPVKVVDGLEHPWSMAWLPDGRMLITERPGRLRLLEPAEADSAPELTTVEGVPDVYAAFQAGLFEVLPDPDFDDNQKLYLSFAHGSASANALRVVRARLEDATLRDVEPIFTSRPRRSTPVHLGGRMAFLDDGTLLVTQGDGFDYREAAQDPFDHLGTVVRIHTDGTIPADNPFANGVDGAPEVYSWGHRNVQGVVPDPATGRIWSHEHGPRGGDELNVLKPGANYGWPVATHGVDYSGAVISPFTERPGMRSPVYVWESAIAPAGLSRLEGDLLVAGLVSRDVRRLELDGAEVVSERSYFGELRRRIRDVRVGPDGAVYLLTDHEAGALLRAPAEALE